VALKVVAMHTLAVKRKQRHRHYIASARKIIMPNEMLQASSQYREEDSKVVPEAHTRI